MAMNIQIFGTNKSFDTKKAQQADKLFENQQLFRQPIVRNGRQATVGYCPEMWEKWE